MWQGRFTKDPSARLRAYGESVSFDRRLALHDIAGSKAHAAALRKAGLLTARELAAIKRGLDAVAREIRSGKFVWREDLEEPRDPRLRVVILVEGADCIRGGEELSWWFERGVRVLGLAWAMGTRAAGGNRIHGGLSAEGRDLVAAADQLGILHDASHLADAAFDDLLACTDRRVVATHSNARWLLEDGDNQRHLTRAQIRSIAERDGAIGLNLYGNFLASGRDATLEDCVRHVEAIAEIAGRGRVGLGSDLDGGFGTDRLPEGLRHPSQYRDLEAALADRGWRDAERRDFRRDTWLRILRASLPSRTPPPR